MNSASTYQPDVPFLSHLKEQQIYCTESALVAQSLFGAGATTAHTPGLCRPVILFSDAERPRHGRTREQPGSRSVLNLADGVNGGRDHRGVAVGPSPFTVNLSEAADRKSQPRFAESLQFRCLRFYKSFRTRQGAPGRAAGARV